jgi:N-acetyl sugar amidotransferase
MKKVCVRCIYDESIPKISFDAEGVCNYCRQYDAMDQEYPTGPEGMRRLEQITDQIKREGKGKPYDVVIGVSGGCDSSYMMHFAREMGLRPLATHFDNTWNSRIAVENINLVTEKLNIDLFTHVMDNDEYNDLFRSFLMASVPEIDTPSDIGLATTHYMAAEKYKIRYIWEGHSFRTEGISPEGWFYMDAKYIQTIHGQFGKLPMKTFPNLWLHKWLKWIAINKIKKIRPLYFMDYDKEATKKMLHDTYGWQWYGGHHMENRTAYFTNNSYLPSKFGIDLRLCEFSALIRSGQMTRDEALEKIQDPKPFDTAILDEVKTRLGFTDAQYEQIMDLERKTFRDYATYKETFRRLRPLFYVLYKKGYVTKSFYHKFCCS